MNTKTDALWQHLEQLLTRWDAADTAQIVLCLQPPEQPVDKSHIALFVRAATHPSLSHRIQQGQYPDEIKQVLEHNVLKIMPRLGLRVVGPLAKLIPEATRVFGAEARKYDLVAKRVAQQSPDERVNTLTAYLQTKPAPLFCQLMSEQFGEHWLQAQEDLSELKHLSVFREQTALLDVLRQTQVDPNALKDALSQSTAAIDAQGWRHRLPLALESTQEDDRLVAAALACHWREIGWCSTLLDHFLAAQPDSYIIGVMAAALEPMMAKQVFSLFLLDMSLGNAEEPEYQLTDIRIQLILAARWLLPHLGSPIDDDQIEALKQSGQPMILDTLEHVESMWGAWRRLAQEA